MNVFRLSFMMERLEHSQGGAFDAAELARIDDVVNYSAGKGIKVVLDPHNFGAVWGNDIGTSGTPASTLTAFNAKLAEHFANTPNVIFGIMNEAHNQSATQWEPIVQDSVNAIRAAGATSQEILVPGTYWQNAKDWTNSDNAAVMGKVTDPNHNMAYELHMYFDAGSGGVQPDTVSPTIGVERIADATKWAEATGNRLFLGEFGVSGDSAGLAALSNTLTYMDQHSDAWQGATYWTAGPAWGDMLRPSSRRAALATTRTSRRWAFCPSTSAPAEAGRIWNMGVWERPWSMSCPRPAASATGRSSGGCRGATRARSFRDALAVRSGRGSH